ncbi:hypothetical protein PAXRUDRAFT_828723 [Paxillus rubicundulus Ve08.2h10]|uniref:Capsular associated protein n=1 Tax=Paxillus rubicundulus Ve08.2h10 TaxID=930991 RepID=A0A0D0E0Y2_9AGAM|nr:hypothetical protein PAXRUDRAFT_828723 [Paxillus rubicundulus Ve08.2h10]
MGINSSTRSWWYQRSFGVPNRIWGLLLAFVSIVALTRHLRPSSHYRPLPFSTVGLVPKNYLHEANYFAANSSEEGGGVSGNPFDFCPVFGPGDDIAEKYGVIPLAQSRLHLGSGGRVHRVIHKALLGQPVTMSVLGGSVSACHGAGDDPLSPICYPSSFFQWWSSVFPHPASELTNGAMRRTNSGYFAFCNAHHVPEHTDLVILEFDVDDPGDQRGMENFELLVRSLLDRPDQPAVVILGHFSPEVHTVHGFAGPDHWHNIVAQFYDVPHISVKPILYPSYMADPEFIKPYFADAVLANPDGHALLADVLISYFQSQICAAWSTAGGHSYETIPIMLAPGYNPGGDTHLFGGVGARKGGAAPELPKAAGDNAGSGKKPVQAPSLDSHTIPIYPELSIPPVRINTRPRTSFEEPTPFCASANDLVNPVPPSLFYGSGWSAAHPQGTSPLLTAGYFWHSSMPLSRLRVPIKVGSGDVGIYYIKEPMNEVEEGSQVECWVDDNFGGAVIIENAGDVSSPVPTLEIIDHSVSRGNHYVECLLLGEEGQVVPPFKIIGIFAM